MTVTTTTTTQPRPEMLCSPVHFPPTIPPSLSSGAPARSDDLTSDGIWLRRLLHARHLFCLASVCVVCALPCHCLTANPTTGTPCRASCHSQNDPKLRADGATVPTAEVLTSGALGGLGTGGAVGSLLVCCLCRCRCRCRWPCRWSPCSGALADLLATAVPSPLTC